MNGIELLLRMTAALRAKAERRGWDMSTPAPDGFGTLGDLLDTLISDAQMITAGLVPVEEYE